MIFTERLSKILKNFGTINESIFFRPGTILTTESPKPGGPPIFAVASLDTEVPSDFVIADVSRFLGVLSLFNAPQDVEIHDNHLIFKQDAKTTRYRLNRPEEIKHPGDRKLVLANIDAEIDLPADKLSQILKGIDVLGVPDLALIMENNNFQLRATDSSIKFSDTFSLDFPNISCENDFELYIKRENLKMLPDDYKLQIGTNRKGVRLIAFTGTDIQYFVAFDPTTSKWSDKS